MAHATRPPETRTQARKEPTPLGDLVMWSHLVHAPRGRAPGPTVIQNKDGSLQATMRYRGPDLTMRGEGYWSAYLEAWNTIIKRLGTGWALWLDEWAEPATHYPQSQWPGVGAYFVDSIRHTNFHSRALLETEYFLTVSWLPPSVTKQYWFETLFIQSAMRQRTSGEVEQLRRFVSAVERLGDALSRILPVCAWATEQETYTYLRRCVSWDRHPVAVPERAEDLDRRLTHGHYRHGHTPWLSGQYLQPIGVYHWPSDIGMTVPASLQQLGFPYRYTVRYICLDTKQAKSRLNRMKARWEIQVLPLSTHLSDMWYGTKTDWNDPTITANEDARAHAHALRRAVDALSAGDVTYGYCTPVILLWDTDRKALAAKERQVVKVLEAHELTVDGERDNASDAWRSMLSSDTYRNVRNPPLASRATGFLGPTGAQHMGEKRDPHLKDHCLFTAWSGNQPYYYTLFSGDVGGTMVMGPTRTGKSGWLALLGTQAQRYPGMEVYAWDRRYALLCATKWNNGAHYELSAQHSQGFNVMGHLDRGMPELRWKHEWLCDLFKVEGMTLTQHEQDQLWDALDLLSAQEPEYWCMTLFARYVQSQRLKAVLHKYQEGERFECFDATQDSFALGAPWTTFEMESMLNLPPHVIGLALFYQFHELEQRFTGEPRLLLFDEWWQFMTIPAFWPKVLLYLKAFAKANVAVVLSTHEVADLKKEGEQSAFWQGVKGAVRSWNFLPNKQALDPDVYPQYQACGLADHEIRYLPQMQEYCDYLHKGEEHCRVYQMPFDPLQRICLAASTPEEILALQRLAREPLTEPWQAAWLRVNHYDAEADMVRALAEKGVCV